MWTVFYKYSENEAYRKDTLATEEEAQAEALYQLELGAIVQIQEGADE